MSHNWPAPLPLIQSDSEHLVIVEETAALLDEIHMPLVVVVIAGIYRTGKSYLMNRLAKKQTGFPLGNTLQSKTKGIWVWCQPHPYRSDCVLVLLDTEGLCDPEKGSEKNDMQLLSLSVLLSSFFVYNAIGRIDNDMIKRLHFITAIIDNITVKARDREEEDDDDTPDYDELREHLPDFALVVRDFALDLEIDEQTVTPDEYFHRVLQPKAGCVRYNRPREAIRRAFSSHKCFVLPRPVSSDSLFCQLELLEEEQLSPTFATQSTEFCDFIYTHAEVKKMKVQDGIQVNGKAWLSLASDYVSTINNDGVPCIESTLANVADKTNFETLERTLKLYQEDIDQLHLPLLTVEVKCSHRTARRKAMRYYYRNSLFDGERNYKTALQIQLSERLRDLKARNKHSSEVQCQNFLESLYNSEIQENIKSQSYLCTNGYDMYKADLNELKIQYDRQSDLNGCMHKSVLCQFLVDINAERQAIKKSVKTLKRQRVLERERERDERIAREAREETESLMQNLEWTHFENEEEIRQEEAEQEMRRERRRREQEETRKRFVEDERRMREEFEREMGQMRAQQNRTRSNDSSNCAIM